MVLCTASAGSDSTSQKYVMVAMRRQQSAQDSFCMHSLVSAALIVRVKELRAQINGDALAVARACGASRLMLFQTILEQPVQQWPRIS